MRSTEMSMTSIGSLTLVWKHIAFDIRKFRSSSGIVFYNIIIVIIIGWEDLDDSELVIGWIERPSTVHSATWGHIPQSAHNRTSLYDLLWSRCTGNPRSRWKVSGVLTRNGGVKRSDILTGICVPSTRGARIHATRNENLTKCDTVAPASFHLEPHHVT
jgi:hypothetical protein